MTDPTVRDRRILVVEDEFMLANELETELLDAGAIVLGPAGTIKAAFDLIRSGQEIDGAILDVSLRGEMSFPVADLLIERGVPFVFTTGYDALVIPSRLEHVMRCVKPIKIAKVIETIGRLIRA